MYGINIDDIAGLRKENSLLVIIGAEKVPQAHDLADYNIIRLATNLTLKFAALAIFLDRIFTGKQFKRLLLTPI